MPVCERCKQEKECRIHTTTGAFGVVDVQTCEDCHKKEIADVKAESKRVGFRLTVPKPWTKLTTRGAYSEVR